MKGQRARDEDNKNGQRGAKSSKHKLQNSCQVQILRHVLILVLVWMSLRSHCFTSASAVISVVAVVCFVCLFVCLLLLFCSFFLSSATVPVKS